MCLYVYPFLCFFFFFFYRLWWFFNNEISDLQSKFQLQIVPHVRRLQNNGERNQKITSVPSLVFCKYPGDGVALYLNWTNPSAALSQDAAGVEFHSRLR